METWNLWAAPFRHTNIFILTVKNMKSLEFSLTKVAVLIFQWSKIIFMMIKLQSLLKSIRHNQERKAFVCLSYLKPTLQ